MSGIDATWPANLVEIERLNQRGGRTLSFVDLVEAGTVSAELAGELAACVEAGAAILTAARPGGAGKSTLLADLLACLPPGERIVTTPDVGAVRDARRGSGGPVCFLAHEIGAGPWYAYLWGSAAAEFFDLAAPGGRVATCLHADDLEELYDELSSQGVREEAVRSVGIIAFMRRVGGKRRVDSVYVPGPKAHRVRWLWEEAEDAFLPQGPAAAPPERAAAFAEIFEELAEGGVRELAEVRRRMVRAFGNSA